jgi:hypothetical protein
VIKQTTSYESPATLVAIIVAARRAGDRELERETRQLLAERYRVRLTFSKQHAGEIPAVQEGITP